MLRIGVGRRTQVVKGEVCKTSMQRFESARRLHFLPDFIRQPPRAHLIERVLRLSTCFAPRSGISGVRSPAQTTGAFREKKIPKKFQKRSNFP
jgi:hypothetical protein